MFVTEELLDQSLNVALIRDGLGYAELYAAMPLDLIRYLRGLIGLALRPARHVAQRGRRHQSCATS